MKDDDLAKTMCLDEDLSELNNNNETLREKKYSNVQEVLDASVNDLKDKEVDENGDVIEDTKPFELETLKLDSKKEEVKEEKELKEDSTKNKKKLKDKWKELPKKKKVLFIILIILGVILITTTIVLLVIKQHKKEEILEPKEEDIIVIKDNYIYKNGSLEFLDNEDQVIGTYECENKDEKLCYVAYNDTSEDNLLKELNLYEDETYILERLNFFNDQYAFVIDNKNEEDKIIELVDFKNNKVLDNYQLVKHYQVKDKNYIVVKNDMSNYRLYEITNEGLVEIINKDYKYLGIIPNKENNYVIGELSTGSYLIGYDGKEVSKLINKKIFNYNDDYIVTIDNDGYSLYNYKNEQKLTGYKYIGLDNDYILLVDNFNKLYSPPRKVARASPP